MSDKEEKIFEKPVKPKRKLTEKQLAALAAGREKARKKKQEKLDREGQKEQKQQRKEQKQEKKKKLSEQEVLHTIKEKEKAAKANRVKEQRLEAWKTRRVTLLEKCESEAQFKLVSNALDTITEDDLGDIHKVNEKLRASQRKLLEAEKKLKEEN
tara:strand:+ start:4922 stop:5386 length:465 start_codon:yes stop_codon:yes gene_type:complete